MATPKQVVPRHPSVPATTDGAGDLPPYPKDGTYEEQLAWLRDRGYPEDGTHEENLEWVRANDQLPPKPQDCTKEDTWAWAKLSTAYLTTKAAEAEGEPATRWLGEDEWEPGSDPEWDDGLWLMPLDIGDLVTVVTGARPRASRRSARSGGSRSPPDDPSDPSPKRPPERPYELGRLDAASARCWAKIRRREARERLASA